MKKIFLSFVLLLIVSINTSVKADELILLSNDKVEIKSDAFIQGDNDVITLVKDSNLFINFTHNKNIIDEASEPKISIDIFDENGKNVWNASSPKTKAPSPQTDSFTNYLEINKVFFNSVLFEGNQVQIKIPLNFEAGKYNVKVSSSNYENISLDYSFELSNSKYSFTDSNIIIEGTSVLANISYISTSNNEETNKVVVTLTQGNNELFKNEKDTVFYKEGNIIVDENVDVLKGLKGQAFLKIEIKNPEGQVILSTTKMVDIQQVNGKNIYYMILALLIVLLITIFILLKKNKSSGVVALIALTFISIGFTGIKTIQADSICGTKPADQCLEDKVKTWVCKVRLSCDAEDIRVKKYFSSGKVLNIAGPKKSADGFGQASKATVNVCNEISQSFGNGDNFYVITDSNGSDWQRKRFHVFSFTKSSNGVTDTVEFDPGGDKRNINTAKYDGNCKVDVYSYYDGDASNYKQGQVAIVEVGKNTPSVCKSEVVKGDVFENNRNMLDKSVCSNGEIRNTYIAGSVYFSPVSNTNPYQDKTVNVCEYLGYTSANKPNGEKFYALAEQKGSWWMIKYPMFQFTFGTPRTETASLNATGRIYWYGAYKENIPSMSYDGNCNIKFRLSNTGSDTDNWSATYKLIELGMTKDVTCYDSEIIKSSSYTYSTRGLEDGFVEQKTRRTTNTYNANTFTPGNYKEIAPFILNQAPCKVSGQCAATGSWIPSYTNESCGVVNPPPQTCSCNNRDYVCKQGTTTVSTITNSDECSLKSSCLVAYSGENTVFTVSSDNAIGNVTFTHDTNVVTKTKTESYIYTTPKATGTQLISVTLKDLFDNQTSSASCSITSTDPNTPTGQTCGCEGTSYVCRLDGNNSEASRVNNSPQCTTGIPEDPVIKINKTPKVSLNKFGACTISWSLENIPSASTCTLSGWGVGGNNNVLTLTDYTSSITILGLETNQKYVISCSGGGISTPIAASVICRVNPNIIEN